MSILLDILGAVSLTAAVSWVLIHPPNESPNKKMCLGIEFEALILSATTTGGVLLFLAAQNV